MQLFLLFHSAGGQSCDMHTLGLVLAHAFPRAAIVSVPACEPSDVTPEGRHWFSTQGLSDDDRPQRIADAMPAFAAAVAHWQAETGVEPQATALVGFSQSGIMALESTQLDAALAGRVIVLSGRFGSAPRHPAPDTTIHLIHGEDDGLLPCQHAQQAAQALDELGGDVTLDILPGVAHEISAPVVETMLERLRTTVPRRLWEAAMRAEADGERT